MPIPTRSSMSLALCILATASSARADVPSMFGFGARAAGLARAGVASDDAAAAARENPALASTPGLRLRLGYGYGAFTLRVDGQDAGVPHVSGVDIAAQYGGHVGDGFEIGVAAAMRLPDSYLARLTFRPATEPQFVLYEASLRRTSFELCGAARYGPLFIGGGIAAGLSVGGTAVAMKVGQDARGTGASGVTDASLPYRLAPIFGVRADLGVVALGAMFRGPMGLDVQLDNTANIGIPGNPLNGTTTLWVSGTAGYDPAVATFGVRVDIAGGLSALGSVEYAVYSATPSPSADVSFDVQLGTTPGLQEVRFPAPRLRDTVSPRVALELRRPSAADRRWSARLGYAMLPSPMPRQSGLTSYADANRHQLAIGGGYRFGRLAGIDLSADAAMQLHLLAPRVEDKKSPALPYAHYEVTGRIVYGTLTLEARW